MLNHVNELWRRVRRAPENEGGNGEGNGDGKGGADDKGGDKGAQGKDGDSSKSNSNGSGNDSLIDLDGEGTKVAKEGERPAHVPEDMWDAEKKALKEGVNPIDEWAKAQKIANDLRQKMGKGEHKPPAKAEDYKLPDLKEEADKGVMEMLKSDEPFMKEIKATAFKYGMSQEQYAGFLSDVGRVVFKAAGDKANEAMTPLTDAEKQEIREAEMAKIGPNAPKMMAAVEGWVKGLIAEGYINYQEKEEIKAMAATATGLSVLNKLRARQGGDSIPMGETLTVDGLKSDAEIFAMHGTEAYKNSNDPGHAKAHAEVERQLDLRRKAGRPELLQVQA